MRKSFSFILSLFSLLFTFNLCFPQELKVGDVIELRNNDPRQKKKWSGKYLNVHPNTDKNAYMGNNNDAKSKFIVGKTDIPDGQPVSFGDRITLKCLGNYRYLGFKTSNTIGSKTGKYFIFGRWPKGDGGGVIDSDDMVCFKPVGDHEKWVNPDTLNRVEADDKYKANKESKWNINIVIDEPIADILERNHGLEIKEAYYGKLGDNWRFPGGKYYDVKGIILYELFREAELPIKNTSFGGDPAKGELKHFRVQVNYKGRTNYQIIIPEDKGSFSLDFLKSLFSNDINITEALYGTSRFLRDVTNRVKHLWNAGAQIIADTGLLDVDEDPAEGERKFLKIKYTLDGNDYTYYLLENTNQYMQNTDAIPTTPTALAGDAVNNNIVGDVEIVSAYYGKLSGDGINPKAGINVTNKVREAWNTNTALRVGLNKYFGSDPASGKRKHLKVLYEYNGREYVNYMVESGEEFFAPSFINALHDANLQIQSVRYGVLVKDDQSLDTNLSSGTDVTDAVQGLWNNNQQITASNALFGDPAQGKVKHLMIEFTSGGNTYVNYIPEGTSEYMQKVEEEEKVEEEGKEAVEEEVEEPSLPEAQVSDVPAAQIAPEGGENYTTQEDNVIYYHSNWKLEKEQREAQENNPAYYNQRMFFTATSIMPNFAIHFSDETENTLNHLFLLWGWDETNTNVGLVKNRLNWLDGRDAVFVPTSDNQAKVNARYFAEQKYWISYDRVPEAGNATLWLGIGDIINSTNAIARWDITGAPEIEYFGFAGYGDADTISNMNWFGKEAVDRQKAEEETKKAKEEEERRKQELAAAFNPPANFALVEGGLVQVDVGIRNGQLEVWGVDSENTIFKGTVAQAQEATQTYGMGQAPAPQGPTVTWEGQPGAASWVSIGSDGTILAISSYNKLLFKWDKVESGEWDWIAFASGNEQAKQLKMVSVGNKDNIWAIDNADNIVQWTGSKWQQRSLQGVGAYVSVASDGTVFSITKDNKLYQWVNTEWELVERAVVQAQTASMGMGGMGGQTAQSQTQQAGSMMMSKISVASEDIAMGIYDNNGALEIYELVGGNWQRAKSDDGEDAVGFTHVAINSAKHAFGLSTEDITGGKKIYYRSGEEIAPPPPPQAPEFKLPADLQAAGFALVPGELSVVAVGGDSIFGIDKDGKLQRYQAAAVAANSGAPGAADQAASPWTAIAGRLLMDVSVGEDNTVMGVGTDNTVWIYEQGRFIEFKVEDEAVAPKAINVACGNKNNIWILDEQGKAYKCTIVTPPGAQTPGGPAPSYKVTWQDSSGGTLLGDVVVGMDGVVFGTNKETKAVVKFDETTSTWGAVGGLFDDIDVVNANNFWGVYNKGENVWQVWQYLKGRTNEDDQAQDWKQIGTGLAQISANNKGVVVGLNSDGKIAMTTTAQTTQAPVETTPTPETVEPEVRGGAVRQAQPRGQTRQTGREAGRGGKPTGRTGGGGTVRR